MILDIPALISGYEITECTKSDDADLCETYKGTSKQQKPVIIVVYNMKAIERSSSKAAYFWKSSCYQLLCSPSFLPLLDQIRIKNKDRNIQIMVFKTIPSMLTLEEKLSLGNIKEEDAWNIIMDLVIGVREYSYKCKAVTHLDLNSNTIYVYQDKRGKLRGIITSFKMSPSSDKRQQFSLALLVTKILQGSTQDDTAATLNSSIKQKPNNSLQGDFILCIKKALYSNPNKRYLSLEDFMKALIHFCPFQMPTTFECFGKP